MEITGCKARLKDGSIIAFDSQHVGSHPHAHAVAHLNLGHVVPGLGHEAHQALLQHGIDPGQALTVLDPLEVVDHDSACVGEDVGDDGNSLVVQDPVRAGRNRAVGAFDHQDVRRRVSETYGCQVAAVIPHSDALMALASAGVFIMRHPKLPLSRIYRELGEIVRKG